ncbi:unnamed protein product [Sphenostylis stenocarpa]|uniref:Uncharacterized protein n=1 Tax=Sphenostylis stenocarpa TaxID=92480 RepID=A0AA86VN15_9FABA|nr:unnamed protein product [Sphenostylis stenocarpa]
MDAEAAKEVREKVSARAKAVVEARRWSLTVAPGGWSNLDAEAAKEVREKVSARAKAVVEARRWSLTVAPGGAANGAWLWSGAWSSSEGLRKIENGAQ